MLHNHGANRTALSRAEIVAVAVSISGRSRSSVYRVLSKKMSSRPVQLAIELAIEILRDRENAVVVARETFRQRCGLMACEDL